MQRKLASSISNPINFPDSSFAFHGGYAPSVPIFILSAKTLVLSKIIEANIDKKSLLNLFIFPSVLNNEFNKDIISQIMIYKKPKFN
tara:strand:- start:2762 stop:3022 length:261 start_codon:yes stop_codon:yes gene_type:complete